MQKLRLWLLSLNYDLVQPSRYWDRGTPEQFVVAAYTEMEARDIASEAAAVYGHRWKSPALSSCREVRPIRPGVISIGFIGEGAAPYNG